MSFFREPHAKDAGGELLIFRNFAAPRDVVFRAWTDPVEVARWWGPRDYPAREMTMDVRVGGVWRGCLRSVADGRNLWHGGVFKEITPPERLAFTFRWEEEGERGLETLVDITFKENGDGTRMIFRQTPFQSVEEREGHRGGWSSAFDRFDEFVAPPAA
ncbi:SRPBCC domain-containing protein [Terrarubrum flagellatum]|uniref:SRPBCC family protein n=1 Tax=Terrirubrum flagellatum TaxID=2895980 RepID=UPI0031454406